MNTIELPDRFRAALYRFTLMAEEPLHLPLYKGVTLRGGFGHAFQRTVCFQPRRDACRGGCLLGDKCPYGYIFETPVPEQAAVLSSYDEAPRPFVIRPPLDRQQDYEPGSTLDFELVLVGRAINYLPYFVVAFMRLGEIGLGRERGRFRVSGVTALHPWDERAETLLSPDGLLRDADLTIGAADVLRRAETLAGGRVTLDLLTPARLKHGGRYVDEGPPFHVLVRALLRRASSLSYFHCGQRWQADYRGIIEAAEAVESVDVGTGWVDWERYSGRQKRHMSLGGLIGTVGYSSDDAAGLSAFHPLLALGELVHVGKATVFGNGWYRAGELTDR